MGSTESLKELLQFAFQTYSSIYIKKSAKKFRGILRNFAKLKSLSLLFGISRIKKNPISRPP
jgi:hypothetical protein